MTVGQLPSQSKAYLSSSALLHAHWIGIWASVCRDHARRRCENGLSVTRNRIAISIWRVSHVAAARVQEQADGTSSRPQVSQRAIGKDGFWTVPLRLSARCILYPRWQMLHHTRLRTWSCGDRKLSQWDIRQWSLCPNPEVRRPLLVSKWMSRLNDISIDIWFNSIQGSALIWGLGLINYYWRCSRLLLRVGPFNMEGPLTYSR